MRRHRAILFPISKIVAALGLGATFVLTSQAHADPVTLYQHGTLANFSVFWALAAPAPSCMTTRSSPIHPGLRM